MITTIIKAVLVITIMVVMIMILISLNRFFHKDFYLTASEMDDLRKELEEMDDVITTHSAFSDLVNIDYVKEQPENNMKKSGEA